MKPTQSSDEVLILCFLYVNEKFFKRELNCEQVAELLGVYRKIFQDAL